MVKILLSIICVDTIGYPIDFTAISLDDKMTTEITYRLFGLSGLLGSVLILSACGGGGGGGSSAVDPEIIVGQRSLAGTYNYYSEINSRNVVRYLYPVDLDNDGLEEIILAGFETAPNTPAEFTHTKVFIFGWQNQSLVNLTSQWLPGGADQVQGVGDITFGDFDDNGHLDVFLTGYSDMDHDVNSLAFMNNGTALTKVTLGAASWEHGVTSGDINGDNYDDVFIAGGINPSYLYLGSASGLVQYSNPDHITNSSGSGIAIADFLGTGDPSIIISDRSGELTSADTVHYTVTLDGSGIPIDYVRQIDLPSPRIETLYSDLDSHDIRVKAFDFSMDGLADVVVFSRPWNIPSDSTWQELSELQFLRNNGGGQFEDVTDTVLVGYKNDSGAAYSPVFADFNGDGRTDIFVSEATFSGTHDSTSILLQSNDGTFVDTGRNDLSPKVQQDGGIASIMKGPNGAYYLITEEYSVVSGNFESRLYYAQLSWP